MLISPLPSTLAGRGCSGTTRRFSAADATQRRLRWSRCVHPPECRRTRRNQDRRPAGASAAGDNDIKRRFDARPQEVGDARRHRPLIKLVGCQRMFGNLRMLTHGPFNDSGGTTTLTREPLGRRVSTIGLDSSTWRPSGTTARSTIRDHIVIVVEFDRRQIQPPPCR